MGWQRHMHRPGASAPQGAVQTRAGAAACTDSDRRAPRRVRAAAAPRRGGRLAAHADLFDHFRMDRAEPCAIRALPALSDSQVDALAGLLVDCVEGGASVSFMDPLPRARAAGFWREVGAAVARGERVLLVAEDGSGIVGTVQVILRQPDNQPHRADVAKMLVHRRARRRGLGAALMRAAEAAAGAAGKTLLVLDTASDTAERLYRRLGWECCGVIPDYALLPRGGYCDTTVLYRRLGAMPGATPAGDPLQTARDIPT